MAKSEAPGINVIRGELPRTVGETLDAIQLDLLPEAIQRDPLAQWIFSDPLRVLNLGAYVIYGGYATPSYLNITSATERLAIQLVEHLAPYYQVTLSEIGQAWNDAERAIAEHTSALEDDHLRASMRLTRRRLEEQKEPSSAAQAILALARDTPDLFIEALRAELTDRREAQVGMLGGAQSCWSLWRQEAGRFLHSVKMLGLAKYAVDKWITPRTTTEEALHLFNNATEQLGAPSALSERLRAVGLEAPIYPAERIVALVNDARREWDKASSWDEAMAYGRAAHATAQSALPSASGLFMGGGSEDVQEYIVQAKDTEERRRSVTKRELSRRVAEKVGLSIRESEKLITSLLYTIGEALAEGDSVQLTSFGRFAVREAPHAPRPEAARAINSVAPAVEFTPSKDLAAAIEAPPPAPPEA